MRTAAKVLALGLAGLLRTAAADAGDAATAAPGYVDDRQCAGCHGELYQSYQAVGMAKSFYPPSPEKAIEDFDKGYYHEPSQRHYEMGFRDGRLVFRRYQVAADGEPIHLVEQTVDWVLGSGHRARTYLYRTGSGELYQLPIAWYTQTASWGMAPGFDRPDHLGLMRLVRRECMFCHNAYPEVAAGSDDHWQPQVFPQRLPHGTGCQRCHGPGAEHVRAATGGTDGAFWVRASIVNPGKLPPRLRDDVCDQCHLQPSVALPRVGRYGRGDYSYRPGEPLTDHLVVMDVEVQGKKYDERFQINHHPYRLRQSRCFLESGRQLSCLTCHDPHRKVPAEDRAAHYRAACLGCHTVEACGLDGSAAHGGPSGSAAETAKAAEAGDCVACHMPRHRPQDVVRVVMTDHLIRRPPVGEDLLAPLAESDPVLLDVAPLDEDRAPRGETREIYRAASVLRASASAAAADRLGDLLDSARPQEIGPYLDLASGQLRLHRFAAAERTLLGVLAKDPDHLQALRWLGVARFRLGRSGEAEEVLRQVVERDPAAADVWFNLGLVLVAEGRFEAAVEPLGKAVALNHHLASGWYYLGLVQARLERPDEAIASYRRALASDPRFGRAYLALGETLLAQGRRAEALRYLRHGVEAAAEPEAVAEALAEALASEAGEGSAGSPQSTSRPPRQEN